ncbi:MAG: hypothetical protein R3189_08035 [Thiomicrorhabdus chilensis]|uniref:hypothetical protein n=1 Tax=Thiomicrorhabdus chilensis TaxID=63656 RepID=UPI0003FA3748|nr:hypothetical protein [Thiomicrorhabdus chilensis]MDX1348182.1 hypothetical protein [Thiomicrorhabdus chilensis]
MTIKQEAHHLVDQLAEDATWDDLVRSLYRNKKITLGMTDIEVVQDEISEADINTVMARLQSSSSTPDDMRNTKTYNPSNSVTASWVLVALAPLLFISILLAPVAYVLAIGGIVMGLKAVKDRVEKAWLPVLVGVIELLLFVALPVVGS